MLSSFHCKSQPPRLQKMIEKLHLIWTVIIPNVVQNDKTWRRGTSMEFISGLYEAVPPLRQNILFLVDHSQKFPWMQHPRWNVDEANTNEMVYLAACRRGDKRAALNMNSYIQICDDCKNSRELSMMFGDIYQHNNLVMETFDDAKKCQCGGTRDASIDEIYLICKKPFSEVRPRYFPSTVDRWSLDGYLIFFKHQHHQLYGKRPRF
jgi:hypothetical protein